MRLAARSVSAMNLSYVVDSGASRDALWDHRRPATLAVRFPGDEDPAGRLDVHAGDNPSLVAARFCEAHAVDDADGAAVAAAAANLQPPLARAWCPR